MPHVNVETALNEAIAEALDELTGPDLVVNYHLMVAQEITYCPGDPDDDDDVGHFRSTLHWRVNLFLNPQEAPRPMQLVGMLPYEMCSDGDVAPMKCLVGSLWKQSTFVHLGDLDRELDQIAAEVEGGG